MKRLFLLFPLYILFLSGIPCSPYDGCCQEELQVAAGQNSDDHNNSNNQKSGFPCSPFFPCGACHGVVIPNHTIQVVEPTPPLSKQPTFYTQRPLLAFVPAIWQPPKQA
jgi:hypothetical protein